MMSDLPQEPESYAQAVEELEAILERIEDSRIDVDVLSSQVERAAYLLKFCRARLTRAETQVKGVLTELQEEDACLPDDSSAD